jgi:hypothetical protein
MAVSTVVAISLLAGGAARANGYVAGMNFFEFGNWGNADGDGSGPAFQPGGWNATTDGAIWISTGGATPVLNTEDLNFQLDYRSTPASPWIKLTGAYLLSNGVAYRDVNFNGTPNGVYPGYWQGEDGATGWGNTSPDSTSPYRITAKGPGIYYLPGTQPTGSPPLGKETQPGMQFNLDAWTGSYNSFVAAAGAGAEVAVSGAFQVGGTAYNDTETPPQTAFLDMPSMVLKPTILGDANLDGKVDVNDLTIVLSHFGESGMTWSQGAFTGSGTVDINDLTIVLSNFGRTAAAPAGGASAVAEPATLLLTAAGLLGLLAAGVWRRRT